MNNYARKQILSTVQFIFKKHVLENLFGWKYIFLSILLKPLMSGVSDHQGFHEQPSIVHILILMIWVFEPSGVTCVCYRPQIWYFFGSITNTNYTIPSTEVILLMQVVLCEFVWSSTVYELYHLAYFCSYFNFDLGLVNVSSSLTFF